MRDGVRLGASASAVSAGGFLVLALAASVAAGLAPADARSSLERALAVAVTLAFLAGLALGRRRLPWQLFAAGFALWAIGSGTGYGDASLSVGDGLTAAGYALLVAAAVTFVPVARASAVDVLLDAGIIATGAGLFLWQLAFEPALHPRSGAVEVFSAVYPTLDIALVVIVAPLLLAGAGRARLGARALAGGFGLLLAADLAYAVNFLYDGTNAASPYVHVARSAAYALFGFAALHPSTGEPAPGTPRPRRLVRARLAVLAVSSFAAPAGFGVGVLRGTLDDPLPIALWGCALVVLLYVRIARLFAEQGRTYAELLRTERVLESAQELARIGGWSSTLGDDETITWSKECARIFGIDPNEFDGRLETFLAVVHPDDREWVEREDAATVAAGEKYELEYRIVRPDGEVRWIYDRGDFTRDATGRPISVSGVIEDVTERHLADQALRDAEARYRTLVEQLPLVTYVTDGTFDGPPSYVSPQIGQLLGYPPSEFTSDIDFLLEAVHPDDRQRFADEIARFQREGDRFECEYRFVDADGREVWVLDQMVAVGDDPANPQFFQGFVVDITTRKRAEQALEEAEGRYRTLVENLPLTSYVSGLTEDAIFSYLSPQIEQLVGYTANELAGNRDLIEEIIHPDDRERIVEESLRMRRDLDRSRLEYRMRARDGRTVWVFDEMVTVRDEQGDPVRFQGFLLDITARKELEEQLEQSRRIEVVGRLAGGIAHDFNNLLTVITGYSGLALERMEEGDPVVRGHVEEVRRAAESAASLTQQMLAFSRRQVLQPQVLELSSVVADIQELLGRMVGEHIELTIDAFPDTPPVLADPGPLEQVLVNLASNARDAMPDGGRLSIETRPLEVGPGDGVVSIGAQPGRYAGLIVRDTGVGMDAATLDRVFEPFFTTKEVGQGSGLGLSSVFGIVRQSGGWTWIDSEPGAGTTVTVYLPSTEAGQEPQKAAPSGRAPEDSRVLLVEDEPVVRELVAEMLEGRGYEVLAAPGPHEALALAEEHGCELLLTDVVMPGMNGRELASQLRELFPNIQVVFTSGYTEDTVLQRGGFGPGERFLAKPFTEADLAAIVREALDALPAPVS